jgi:hypothetical protein
LRSRHPQRFLDALDRFIDAAREKIDRLPLDALDEIGAVLASALKVYLEATSPPDEDWPTTLSELWRCARGQIAFQPDQYLFPYLNPLMGAGESLSQGISNVIEIADQWHNRTYGGRIVSSTQVHLMCHVVHAFVLYLREQLESWTLPF